MSNPIPSSVALSLPSNGTTADATQVASDFTALQNAANELIAALSGGTIGQFLTASDATDVAWSNTATSFSTGAVANSFAALGAIMFSGLVSFVSSAAANNILTGAVQNDANWRVQVRADGSILFGPGATAADTSVARSAPGQVTLGGTVGKGNIVGGAASNNVGGPATLTPDAACLFNRWNLINASGTYTIAAPANPPSGNQSALLIICIHNASGGTVTLSWNAAYSNAPITPTNGNGNVTGWAWNPGTSKWDLVFASGSIAD